MKCYLCGRTAKKLEALDANGLTYTRAYEEPAFCSKRCAANWALIEIADKVTNAELHVCKKGILEMDEESQCEICSPQK